MGRIIVFSTPGCRYCEAAKVLLDKASAPYHVVNLGDAKQGPRIDELRMRSGYVSVPQIFFNSKHVKGGLSALRTWEEEGALREVLAAAIREPDAGDLLTAEEWLIVSSRDREPVAVSEPAPSAVPLPLYKLLVELVDELATNSPQICTSSLNKQPPVDGADVDFTPDLLIGSRRAAVKTHHNCFSGAELVSWVRTRCKVDKDSAADICQALHKYGMITHILHEKAFEDSSGVLFRLHDHDAFWPNASGDCCKLSELAKHAVPETAPSPATCSLETECAPSVSFHPKTTWDACEIELAPPSTKQYTPSSISDEITSPISTSDGRHPSSATSSMYQLLNMQCKHTFLGSTPPRAAAVLAEELRDEMLIIAALAISSDGHSVNYTKLRASDEFRNFVIKTAELQSVDIFDLDDKTRKAFFINLYNVLVIHATAIAGPPQSTWERVVFFTKIGYRIGPYVYTLDDIEHGVLRSNRRHPYQFAKRFGNSDPRLKLALPVLDPRIHFALVCGAKSCPPIRVYNPSNLEAGLHAAAESFLREPSNFDVRHQDARTPAADMSTDSYKHAKRVEICLSKIFQWYADDFGESHQACLTYLLPFLCDTHKQVVSHLLGIAGPPAAISHHLPAELPNPDKSKRKIVAELSALFPVRHRQPIATVTTTVPEAPKPSADCACSPMTSFRGIGGPLLPKITFTFSEYDWGLNGS